MNLIVTATYTAAYKKVTIDYMMDDAHEFVVCGDVSDAELDVLIAAGGSNVDGWECSLA